MISAHNIVKAVLRQDMTRSAYYRTRIDEDMELMKRFVNDIYTHPNTDDNTRAYALSVLNRIDKAPAVAPFED